MTSNHGDPGDRPHDQRIADAEAEKPQRPSVVQTIAGGLTAITVTYLMSFLGVAGTVIGVGLVSILTVLGNYMYSSAMHSAKQKLKEARPKVTNRAAAEGVSAENAGPGGYQEASPAAGYGGTDSSQVFDDSLAAHRSAGRSPADPEPGRWGQAWATMVERYGRKRIFGSIALVFVLLAGTVTVIELSAGQSLSSIVRGEDGSGTSFFGGGDGEDQEEGETDDGGEVPPPQDEQWEGPDQDDEGVDQGPEQPEDQGPAEEPQDDEGEEPAPQEEAPQP